MKIVRPCRATRSWVQHLHGTPETVFPLLCPVREAEWIEGWDPLVVVSESGVAERDCVFVTSEPEATWIVTDYDPPRRIEFIKVTTGATVARISIVLEPARGSETDATVTYSHTALSSEGEKLVQEFTEAFYEEFMQKWQTALNAFLERNGQVNRSIG